MDRKYLMIDSTYRDRFLYPNPAEFILPINTPAGNTVFNSKNPILQGYTVHNFCFLDDSGSFTGTIVAGNPLAIQVADNIDNLTGLNNPLIGTTLDEASNMFLNLALTVGGDSNIYAITGYDPIRHIIYVDTSIIGFSIGNTYTIISQSTPQSIVLQGYVLAVSGISRNNDGYFISSNKPVYVWDQTLNEVRTGFLQDKAIVLDEPFSAGWSISDRFSVSISPPVDTGYYTPLAPGTSFLGTGLWRYELITAGEGYTNGAEVQVVEMYESRPAYALAVGRISNTTTGGGIARMELLYCGDGYTTSGEYYIQPVGDPFRPTLARLRVIATAVGFVIETSNTDLVGSYFMPLLMSPAFRINPSNPSLLQASPNNSMPFSPARILPDLTMMDGNTINGATPILDVLQYNDIQVILTQPFNAVAYSRFQCTNLESFPEVFHFQIYRFKRDGCVAMDYRGTTVSSNQMICYALTVNTLILPNQILNLPFGSLTSSYPYVLLEITNETASSGHNKSVIYSNNPNTVNATFVCSISDVNSPVITKFININSDRSSQVIKFKPNDNLKFRISMPDGRTFETENKDYIPPLSPNPLLQINCLIEIVRL